VITRVAGIQTACSADRDQNLAKAASLVEMAADGGAKVACFEPFFNTRWFPRTRDEASFALAEEADGPTLSFLRELALKHDMHLVAPLFERDGDRRFYTAFVIRRNGEVAGRYRKVHIPEMPLWHEQFHFSPGDLGFPVFDLDGLAVGIQICWDNFFPEGARILALKGAQLILAPTAAAFYSHHRWETAMAATAIVNGVYLMRVNRVGREEEQHFYGRSFCVDPDGDFIIGPTDIHDGVVMADIDPARVERVRSDWDFFSVRRPDAYRALVDTSGPAAGTEP
jgi:N-carbamoylputrescine amidase